MKEAFLIGALGAPCSGKTTLTALIFGELKKAGFSIDYLPEYARTRIREMKYLGLDKEINKEQQVFIRNQQENLENFYLKNNGKKAITLTDGSTTNSFFYQGATDFPLEIARYDLIIFSRRIDGLVIKDINRIHDRNFSKNVDRLMLEQVDSLCPLLKSKVITLEGGVDERLGKALKAITFLVQDGENKLEASNS